MESRTDCSRTDKDGTVRGRHISLPSDVINNVNDEDIDIYPTHGNLNIVVLIFLGDNFQCNFCISFQMAKSV